MKLKSAAIAVLLFTCSILSAQEDVGTSTLVKVGDRMPSFMATSLSGKTLTSEELKGKVVLINFWATWCPPCKTELPRLQKNIYDKIKDDKFVVLCISRGEQKEVVQNFITKNKYTFPVYLDSAKITYNLFATRYIPRNFVVGKDGKIKWAGTGYVEKEFDEMVKLIENELKN